MNPGSTIAHLNVLKIMPAELVIQAETGMTGGASKGVKAELSEGTEGAPQWVLRSPKPLFSVIFATFWVAALIGDKAL